MHAILRRAGGSWCILLALAHVATAQQAAEPAAPRKAKVPEAKVAALVQAFRSAKSFWQQGEVADKLIAAGDRSVIPKIEDILKHEQRSRRCNAGLVLAGLGDERGFRAIVVELKDTGPRAVSEARPGSKSSSITSDRYYAVHVLGQLGDKRAVPILLEYLSDETIDYQVAIVLGQLGDKRAIPPLKKMLQHEDPRRRISVACGLTKLGDPVGLPALAAFLKDPNWYVRYQAADALGFAGDPEALPLLVEALADPHQRVRASAVRALGDLGDRRAVPPLLKALEDRELRHAAAIALRKVGDPRALPALRKALADEPEAAGGQPYTLRHALQEAIAALQERLRRPAP